MIIDTSAMVAILYREPEAEAYALAKATGEPLLFKGADFSRTDVRSALDLGA